MKRKKIIIGTWFLQDLLQVFFLGFCLVPNIYLASLLLVSMLDFSNDKLSTEALLWAFVGGFFYDLRWTNIPGCSSLSWCLALALATAVWEHIPVNTRDYASYFLLSFFTLLFSELFLFIFFANSSLTLWKLLFLSVLLCLLVAFLSSIVYKRNDNSDF